LLDTPSDGSYVLNGKPVANLKMAERSRIRNREIGFIFHFRRSKKAHSIMIRLTPPLEPRASAPSWHRASGATAPSGCY